MFRQTAENPPADDADIRGWIAEAGDLGVDPRPDHVEDVRASLLGRLGIPAPARSRPRPLWWLAAACILAAAALGLLGLPGRSDNAWARVVEALQERTWIHLVDRGSPQFSDESWISPRHEIVAFRYDHGPAERSTEYHDLRAGIYFKYVPEENAIYRLTERGDFKERTSRELDFWRKLIRGEPAAMGGFLPDTAMVGPQTREITEGGKTWTAYEWTMVKHARVDDAVKRVRLLVDPGSRLPRFFDLESVAGEWRRREFAYPDSGPADIVAMGVPATAKRVDRVPGDDLVRILDGLKSGRNRFDDYRGYVLSGSNVWRVWRRAHQWRVESVFAKREGEPRPEASGNADVAWWRDHQEDFYFQLQALCDGRTVWFYSYQPQVLGPNEAYVPQKPSSVTSHKAYGSADDPMMPWPHLLPEQIGHPQIDLPTAERRFTLDGRPQDGPPGTIRLRVRDTGHDDPAEPDRYRLWIDPERNHLAIRTETCVYDRPTDASGKASGPWRIHHVEVNILEDFARSPSGFWYPTWVRRQTPVDAYNKVVYGDTVTRFVLDFGAEFPAGLFEPLR